MEDMQQMGTKQAVITVGPSASGKTRWVETKFSKEVPDFNRWAHANLENIRRKVMNQELGYFHFGNLWEKYNFNKWEHIVSRHNADLIDHAIKNDMNILISNTNINQRYRDELVRKLVQNGYDVKFVYFFEELKVLLKNDAKRNDSVGYEVITKQYYEYIHQFGHLHGFIKHDSNRKGQRNAVVFDVDGTLANNVSGRSPYAWDKVHLDEPNPDVVRILNAFKHDHVVIIVSGRDSVCKDATLDWMKQHDIWYDEAHFRPAGDTRPDWIVKTEILRDHIDPEYNVKLWVDDRPVVVRNIAASGVKTHCVSKPFIEF